MKTLITSISIFLLIFSNNIMANTNISHAIAMHGEPKYNEDFLSVEYVSNSAVKGGNIVRSSIGTYDTFNPFTLKGTSAAGIGFLYESLTVGSSDEAFTEYGLLAKQIEWPKDRSPIYTLYVDVDKQHNQMCIIGTTVRTPNDTQNAGTNANQRATYISHLHRNEFA